MPAKKTLKASKTIQANYSPEKSKNKDQHKFKITGRGPTVLSYGKNAPQGDHVSAYRLIEEGIYRALNHLKKEEVESLFEKSNRGKLRSRRSKLYIDN